MNFVTKLRRSDVALENLEHHPLLASLKGLQQGADYDIEDIGFVVKWECDLEVREWGIKSVCCIITDVTGSFTVIQYEDVNQLKETVHEITFSMDDEYRGNVEFDVKFDEYQQLQINSIQIDFWGKSICTD